MATREVERSKIALEQIRPSTTKMCKQCKGMIRGNLLRRCACTHPSLCSRLSSMYLRGKSDRSFDHCACYHDRSLTRRWIWASRHHPPTVHVRWIGVREQMWCNQRYLPFMITATNQCCLILGPTLREKSRRSHMKDGTNPQTRHTSREHGGLYEPRMHEAQ